jgi:hypothetical protein
VAAVVRHLHRGSNLVLALAVVAAQHFAETSPVRWSAILETWALGTRRVPQRAAGPGAEEGLPAVEVAAAVAAVGAALESPAADPQLVAASAA